MDVGDNENTHGSEPPSVQSNKSFSMIPRIPPDHELTRAEKSVFLLCLILVIAALSACASATPTAPVLERVTATPAVRATPYPWTDASDVMSGICFESVNY